MQTNTTTASREQKSHVGRLCESARPVVSQQVHTNSKIQLRKAPSKHLPRRLRRLTEIHSPVRPLFFLTFCTANRAQLLAATEVHSRFQTFCEASPEKAAVWVGRYVLMPDHMHVFVSAEDSVSVSRWVGSLKKQLAAYWRTLGKSAPFWQEGFFDHVLRSGESYGEKWEYVRQNPVRAGLVKDADDWPYAGEIHQLEWDGNK